MVLTRAGMPHIKHALIFFPHWRLGVKTVSSGVKMCIAPFHINHKADITEVTCFSGGVKAEEGDTTFIDGLLVLQLDQKHARMIHLHNVDDSAAGFFFQLAKLAIQFTHL